MHSSTLLRPVRTKVSLMVDDAMFLTLPAGNIGFYKESQAQMATNVCVKRLFGYEIVCDRAAGQIPPEFARGLEITETVVIEDSVSTFSVRYPMRARASGRVQIDNGALVPVTLRRQSIAHENTAKIGYF